MFNITDAERLRDAYALLMFMQMDVSKSAEQRDSVKNFVVDIKREIRAYNNRPAPTARIVRDDGIDGYVELVQFPDELDRAHKEIAADWFRDNCYLDFYPTPYDCSGQKFTSSYHMFRRRGHWFAYHNVRVDI